jgi:hypothetical protein
MTIKKLKAKGDVETPVLSMALANNVVIMGHTREGGNQRDAQIIVFKYAEPADSA